MLFQCFLRRLLPARRLRLGGLLRRAGPVAFAAGAQGRGIDDGPARVAGGRVVLLTEEGSGCGQDTLLGRAGTTPGEGRCGLQLGADGPGPPLGDGLREAGEDPLLVILMPGQPLRGFGKGLLCFDAGRASQRFEEGVGVI
jgi:hypothetical protein